MSVFGGNGGEETWWGVGRSVYLLVRFHENHDKEPVLAAAVPFSAVITLEANVYVFIASDMGRVASVNIRGGKSLSLGSPFLWQKSLFKYPSRLQAYYLLVL